MTEAASIRDIFTRNIGTFSPAQQDRLQQSRVTIVGCGGLGGFVLEELARTGIGSIKVCDPDIFASSNLNRQLFATKKTIGRNKTAAAAKRISTLHNHTTVQAVPTSFQDNSEYLLSDADVVVDCLDTGASRLELAELCCKEKLPLVHGAVALWYGQVGVQDVGSDLIRRLYGNLQTPEQTVVSVIVCTVATVASLQVAETCKLLLGIPSPLCDNWMSIDLQEMSFEITGKTI